MHQSSNAEQATYWTAQAGPTWVTHQRTLDITFQPVLDGVLDRASLLPGESVLDIGCGTGAGLVQAARAVGPGGFVLGADISAPMLNSARQRAAGLSQVGFLHGDAATHDFEAQRFDRMISRFGVMFFADPTAAFRNISKALKPGAQLVFAAWGEIRENPWFVLPAQAAKAHLGAPPPVDPDEPGPFAFRHAARVEAILAAAGLDVIATDTRTVLLTPPGTLTEMAELATHVGPVSRALQHFQAGEDDRLAIRAGVEKLFSQFATPESTRIPAQIHFFQARVAQN